MRALHAVTLHTPAQAFGGPVRVAVNLTAGLADRGVESRIVALGSGFDGPLPDHVDGRPARLYPARRVLPGAGFSGITSPGLLAGARRLVRAADVVHVHLARDLVTLPIALAALRAGRPLVVQTHGMVDPSDKALARLLDAVAVRRVLRRAGAVLHLTPYERRALDAVLGTPDPGNGVRLVNGVPAQERRPRPPGPPRLLLLARMQARKRPADFVAAAPEVLHRHPGARFVLAGADEGELDGALKLAASLGVAGSVEYLGALAPDAVADELRRAHVHVLPSVDEPFPMSVLEALSLGVPSVVTPTNGLADDLSRTGAGRVAGTPGHLAGQILTLLDPAANDRASAAAWQLARTSFSLDAVADRLHTLYESLV
ncbi:glycosyltransferase [Streptomyces tropicalis]|uniref:D-inositol 3-phosphate glycosyltransferase n=1 Tax=Streptomyces tropicalis TaxID=3034234 RepID=A0ABT6ADF6_9ACTN|nr:glycosyltransferase [Streptomyces tropicalis]MDF3302696.1 glycosyltransferase [Streptomyces tropicalis]